MKLEKWLKEEDVCIIKNIGIFGLILNYIPTQKALHLSNILWAIKWSAGDSALWEKDYYSNDNDISKHHSNLV